MTSNQEKALASHAAGMNCAQSVLTTYSPLLDFDAALAENIAFGFGSGMGRLQETCGAVTGAFMAISVNTSRQGGERAERKATAITQIQEFHRRFTEIHGTKSCRLLLGCDMNTEEGRDYYAKNNLSATVCDRCIADAVKIVDDLIAVE